MEPTPRRERSSSRKLLRYAPFVIVVVAVVVIWIAFGRGDDGGKSSSGTSGGTTKGPVVLNDANRDSIDWGKSCDVRARHRRGPPLLRAAVRRALQGRQRRCDRAGRHQGHDHDRALPGAARHPRADVLPAVRLGRVAEQRARDRPAVRRLLRGPLRDVRPAREDRAGEGERRTRRRSRPRSPTRSRSRPRSRRSPPGAARARPRSTPTSSRPAASCASATACSPRPTST